MIDPSIHIKKSDFKKLLNDCGIKLSDKKVDMLFLKSINYNLKNRYLVLSNKKTIIDKLLKTHKRDSHGVELFNGLLNSIRKDKGHKYVRVIMKDSRDYAMLKEINLIAIEFCETFEIDQRKGFTDFIRFGLDIIGKNYALSKFKYHKEKIFKYKEIEILISNDSDKYLTNQIYEYYCEKVLQEAGIEYSISTIEDYANLVYTKQCITDNNADYKHWIDAQFEKLAFVEAIPNLNQLHGENAIKRFNTSNLKVKKNKIDESNSVLSWFQ